MGITIIGSGSPEAARSVAALTQELVHAVGRYLDLQSDVAAPATIVLNIQAIAPSRGVLPNGTRLRRGDNELWSTHNIAFDAYVHGDARGKLDAIGAALVGALEQTPDSRMGADDKQRFVAAMQAGVQLLLSEPDRLRPFEARLVPD